MNQGENTSTQVSPGNSSQDKFHCSSCCDAAKKPAGITWDKIKDNLNKVIIPLCLPLALLFFTFRQNKIAENKKQSDIEAANKKAESDKQIAKQSNQLETEIKVLAIIWPDLTSTDPTKIKNALELSNSFLRKIYVEKSDSMSPLLTSVSVIAKNLRNDPNREVVIQATNFDISTSKIGEKEKVKGSIVPSKAKSEKYEVKDYVPVAEQKTQIAANLKNANLNSLPKVFIQYSDLKNKEGALLMAQQLSNTYIVPPIEFVSNTVGYGNEIRYYNENSLPLATEIQNKLFKITGTSFVLKNINYPNSVANTIEIWYNNESSLKTVSYESGDPLYTTVAKYENLWFKPKYALNFKEHNLSVVLSSLNKTDQSAVVELDSYDNSFSDHTLRLSKEESKKEFTNGKYKYIILLKTIAKAGRNFFIPDAAYVDVIILQKK